LGIHTIHKDEGRLHAFGNEVSELRRLVAGIKSNGAGAIRLSDRTEGSGHTEALGLKRIDQVAGRLRSHISQGAKGFQVVSPALLVFVPTGPNGA
jgi:hypothetical protein